MDVRERSLAEFADATRRARHVDDPGFVHGDLAMEGEVIHTPAVAYFYRPVGQSPAHLEAQVRIRICARAACAMDRILTDRTIGRT